GEELRMALDGGERVAQLMCQHRGHGAQRGEALSRLELIAQSLLLAEQPGEGEGQPQDPEAREAGDREEVLRLTLEGCGGERLELEDQERAAHPQQRLGCVPTPPTPEAATFWAAQ